MSIYNPGDTITITYEARRAPVPPQVVGDLVDATVAVVMTRNGSPFTPPAVTHPATGIYQIMPTLPLTGDYLGTWTATGAVEDTADFAFVVGSTAGPFLWEPGLREVADFIPILTREEGNSEALVGTFTTWTHPTDETVARLIRAAAAVVEAEVGSPIMPAAYPILGVATAIRAAWYAARSHPGVEATLIAELRTEADAELVRAQSANQAAGGGGDTSLDGRPVVVPAYSFPTPVRWADTYNPTL